MKKIAVGIVSASMLSLSGPLSARVGEHGTLGLVSGVEHLLADHGYLLVLLGVVAAALILKRLNRG
ncbi:MAG: hypothetical protein G8D61_11320 [gamma proteobacterium symbiont of Ctena orbiculata]